MYPSQLVMVQVGQHPLQMEQVQVPLLVDSVVVAVIENERHFRQTATINKFKMATLT